jgi:hypothetical protein
MATRSPAICVWTEFRVAQLDELEPEKWVRTLEPPNQTPGHEASTRARIKESPNHVLLVTCKIAQAYPLIDFS